LVEVEGKTPEGIVVKAEQETYVIYKKKNPKTLSEVVEGKKLEGPEVINVRGLFLKLTKRVLKGGGKSKPSRKNRRWNNTVTGGIPRQQEREDQVQIMKRQKKQK